MKLALKNFRHSLKFKITVIIVVLQALLLAAVLGITLRYSLEENRKQWEIKEQAMIGLLADLSRIALLTTEYDDLQPYVEEVVNDPHIDAVLVANKNNRVVVSNEFILIGSKLPELENWRQKSWLQREISNSAGKLGTVAIRFSHENLQAVNRGVVNLALTIATVGLVIIALIGVLIGKLLTRRLEILTDVAQRMANGDLSIRSGLRGRDEIAIVGQAFDKMGRSVQFNLDALRSLTDELEDRVEQRTGELQVARDAAVQADRSKSAFLANMSHEIRTPLTAIIGFSESLLDSNHSEMERTESINTIINSGRHLLQIINDILDLSKIEADKLEVDHSPVSPYAVIDDVTNIVTMMAESKGLILKTEYGSLLPKEILSDELRFKQILINLCNNAIKFTDEGSVRIKVDCDKKARQLVVQVIDTGVGMTDEQLDKLFRPFSQADSSASRKYGGTGLGLHLSRELAHKLGGNITVESTREVGSCFTLTLDTGPLDHATFIAPPALIVEKLPKAANASSNRVSGKVLLAEDNPDNQRLVTMLIRKAGAEVDLAENGQQAVDMALHRDYDLVLMDLQMPVMNGLDAIRKLRINGYNKPIVALTANAMKIDIEACEQAGADDFTAKPIEREKFYKVLVKYLAASNGETDLDNSPIVSSLLAEEPDIADLLQSFIDRLPETLEGIRQTLAAGDTGQLQEQVHDLKGVSGNYGYKALFELCQNMEHDIQAERLKNLGDILDRMEKIVHRIRMGLPDNVLPIPNKSDKR